MEPLAFDSAELFAALEQMGDEDLDALDFGVIRMAPDATVTGYNDLESRMAGLTKDRVVGRNFFTEVAPCCNNFMVASRFEEPGALDDIIPYVFTLRMRPTPVKLRLIKRPEGGHHYILVLRGAA